MCAFAAHVSIVSHIALGSASKRRPEGCFLQKKTPPSYLGGGPTMLISLTSIYRPGITASLKALKVDDGH